MTYTMEEALKDLRDCDQTQGGVIRALRLMGERIEQLENEIALLKVDGPMSVWEALAGGIDQAKVVPHPGGTWRSADG
jgi:uncharacterized protein with HEPN domain